MDTYQRLQLEAQEVEAHAELRRAELRRVPPAQPRQTRAAARGSEPECTHSARLAAICARSRLCLHGQPRQGLAQAGTVGHAVPGPRHRV